MDPIPARPNRATFFFADALALQAAGYPPPEGSDPAKLMQGLQYLLKVDLTMLTRWREQAPFWRRHNAVKHVVQGHLREVFFSGTIEQGTLQWRVMPSTSWSLPSNGYVVSSVVENSSLAVPICTCKAG